MFKRFPQHLWLAGVFLFLTLGQQYLFYYFKSIPIVWLSPGKYLGVFAFFLAATFIKSFGPRFFFLAFILLLNFFQMSHLSYFGTQILPNEIFLLLTQYNEIQGTLFVETHHLLVPLLFTIIPAGVGYWALKKNQNIFGSKIIGILFCLYFIYNPARTFITGNTWGRQPSTRELSGMNVYLSFSYFLGKILPHKISRGAMANAKNSSSELKLTLEKPSEWDKIIIVLGESLTPHHMELFGYQRPTTPFLVTQKDSPDFFHTIGLSGGVSTDIAVAFLLNMGFGEVGSLKASKGEHCLFKLAKQQSYSTHYLSIQSAEQLRYIAPYLCASSLDDYKSLEDISPETQDHQSARDRDLIRYLRKIIDFDVKQFIVLHQRGSHSPWEMRSDPGVRKFPHENQVNHYDNSIVEFDLFMRDLHKLLNESKKKVLVVYVSDHGEGLGENGIWGHGRLVPSSFEVPIIIQAFNKALPQGTRNLPKFPTHYNLSLFLSQELGFKSNQDALKPLNDYMIFGNDIDGFAGKAQILFRPDGTYDYKVID